MPLDVFQQVASLSVASNAVNDRVGTQANLQAALTALVDLLVPAVGDWQVVWGPVVWKDKPDDDKTGPDNSWYIAYNPALTFEDGTVHPTYVVAVAGTANKTTYAWSHENFAVDSVADFNLWVAGTAYVAIGTVKAVHNLLTFTATQGTASAGTSLLDFLSNVELDDTTRVVFTGHSLGGALSPTLAQTLVSSGVLPADGALAYPVAGASPGNGGFAALFAATFPARGYETTGYQTWNLNIVNTLDIVPQAWCALASQSPAQNLDNIPPIYGTPAIPLVSGAILLAKLQAFRSGTIYAPIQSHLLPGTRPEVPPATIEEFLREALAQHSTFYAQLFALTPPTVNESFWLEYGLGEKTKKEKLYEYPVISNVEWAAEHPEEVQAVIDAEGK